MSTPSPTAEYNLHCNSHWMSEYVDGAMERVQRTIQSLDELACDLNTLMNTHPEAFEGFSVSVADRGCTKPALFVRRKIDPTKDETVTSVAKDVLHVLSAAGFKRDKAEPDVWAEIGRTEWSLCDHKIRLAIFVDLYGKDAKCKVITTGYKQEAIKKIVCEGEEGYDEAN